MKRVYEMKFRCERIIAAAGGSQEFEVEASSLEEARSKFEKGQGELVATECEVTDLEDYDLDNIWEEDE